jgi:hypothetical protein
MSVCAQLFKITEAKQNTIIFEDVEHVDFRDEVAYTTLDAESVPLISTDVLLYESDVLG